uniref:Uncharacterized protein n=1 Tax=Siphoviridae sp. ctX926 TaxID=2826366 RepID=A0A8S5M170_9CAUD|nr:MAG TPA: hypothetical protein [Siphoviridae sp. ctX926]
MPIICFVEHFKDKCFIIHMYPPLTNTNKRSKVAIHKL